MISEPPDWEQISADSAIKTAAAHSYGATKRLERIEGYLIFIAIGVAAIFGKMQGWY